jgi:hypothetical protein
VVLWQVVENFCVETYKHDNPVKLQYVSEILGSRNLYLQKGHKGVSFLITSAVLGFKHDSGWTVICPTKKQCYKITALQNLQLELHEVQGKMIFHTM